MKSNDEHRYDDIINLEHHISKTHPHMDKSKRAAQFAPFAALTGYEDAVNEAARITSEKIILDESKKEILNERLNIVHEHLDEVREVVVTYFEKDQKKEGGSYQTITGHIKKIDMYKSIIVIEQKNIIINDIIDIQSDYFEILENKK